MNKLILIIELVFFSLVLLLNGAWCYAKDNDTEQAYDLHASHGTLNLVISCEDYVVGVTDSRASFSNGTHEDKHQKLFKITDKVFCMVAGFGTDYQRYDRRNNEGLGISASGIIAKYVEEIEKKKHEPGVDEAVEVLAFEFERYIVQYEKMILDLSNEGEIITSFITVFGYDQNNKIIIRQINLEISRCNGSVNIKKSPVENWTAGKVKYHAAGPPDIIKEIVKPYIEKYSRDKHNTLSIEEVLRLEKIIMKEADKKHSGIGGFVQVVKLKGGKLLDFVHEDYPRPPKPLLFELRRGNEFAGGYISRGESLIMIGNLIRKGDMFLDESYFSGNKFENCTVRYNGGLFIFQENNMLIDTELVLEPGIQKDDKDKIEYLERFNWKEIKSNLWKKYQKQSKLL